MVLLHYVSSYLPHGHLLVRIFWACGGPQTQISDNTDHHASCRGLHRRGHRLRAPGLRPRPWVGGLQLRELLDIPDYHRSQSQRWALRSNPYLARRNCPLSMDSHLHSFGCRRAGLSCCAGLDCLRCWCGSAVGHCCGLFQIWWSHRSQNGLQTGRSNLYLRKRKMDCRRSAAGVAERVGRFRLCRPCGAEGLLPSRN